MDFDWSNDIASIKIIELKTGCCGYICRGVCRFSVLGVGEWRSFDLIFFFFFGYLGVVDRCSMPEFEAKTSPAKKKSKKYLTVKWKRKIIIG